MRKMRKNRELIRSPILLLLAISVSLAVMPAFAYDVLVPGDLDGDLIVSDEELEAAQSSYDDGNITSEELEKIEQIHENYPRTITDMAGREVTLYKPAERIITTNPDNSRMVIALGAGHLLVGADDSTVGGSVCPKNGDQLICKECWERVIPGGLNNLPTIGSSPNYELMASLRPDLIIVWGSQEDMADEIEERVGAPAFVGGPDFAYETITAHARAIGAVLSREQEAEDLIAFIDSKVKLVTDITDTIPESEKPKVYFASRGAGKGFYDPTSGRDFTRTTNTYYPLTMAGGINVAKDCADGDVNIALEQLIVWNPDVIFIACSTPDDSAGVDFILTAPELQSIKAVQEGRVYNVFYPHSRGRPHDKNLLNVFYMAKILYPDKFADIDLEKEGNEIMKAFLRVDGVFTDYADYLVWPREYMNSQ